MDHADLRRSSLIGANLTDTILSCVRADGANFERSKLIRANLIDSYAEGARFFRADLSEAEIVGAMLESTNFSKAALQEADLTNAVIKHAHAGGADLRKAILVAAEMQNTILFKADLRGADLTDVILDGAQLVETDLRMATLVNCSIYGASVWNVKLADARQESLRITAEDEPNVTVDNLEVGQFIHLLLSSSKLRDVIKTVTSKVVLILGRFTPERKEVLNAIRSALSGQDYVPVIFDFEKPVGRSFTETVTLLAHLSRFIIVDITDPRSAPQELQAIIPTLRVPIKPIILAGQLPYGMFSDFKAYPWVLEVQEYDDPPGLIAMLRQRVIEPAEESLRALGRH